MERSEALRTVSAVAADQWGLVTTAQAEAAGVSRVDLARLVEADLLAHPARSVYQVTGAGSAPHLEIKSAWLRLDPVVPAWERQIGDERSGVVSHASACQLHDIGDIPADDVEISVPRRRTTREPGVLFHRIVVPVQDVTIIDGLPVTTVDRTICDLLTVRADAGHIGRVVADADQRGLTDTRVLAERIQPFARFYGLPRTASGSDLLDSLTAQAGFVLRDHQLNSAGQLAAVASALDPAPVLEELIDRLRGRRFSQTTALSSPTPAELALAKLMRDQSQGLGELHKRLEQRPYLSHLAAVSEGIAGQSLQERLAALLERSRAPIADLTARQAALAAFGTDTHPTPIRTALNALETLQRQASQASGAPSPSLSDGTGPEGAVPSDK
ncbi:type IV toxin-antitoxin system AbiEi family antitoxin domain-containing protein [Streptomyces sp. NBC_01242]|uniref:type IV toxin-antitoxin system AbiEi family antitoxin domain-containing protein n=1 Tax=Streptomyces sp. NBC_01242 TaxID=2903795 RepID=UPI00224CF982|nr:type IV toxin-antitoxin system AbiEi family antitoxin domain-containing protein [Streptomyces sp. NBC_01242]MCX4799938.1 type IV toxin-antitoxin system AbiEi family antitoxin domain-containing protein [Streptomyces sp. NBC_01242]